MGKRFFTILAVAVLMGTVVFLGLSGAAQEVPDHFVIKAKLWKDHTKSGVEFSHKKHAEEYGAKCTDCHHVMLSLIHISEPTRPELVSRMPSSA